MWPFCSSVKQKYTAAESERAADFSKKEAAYRRRFHKAIADLQERFPIGSHFYYLDTLFIVTGASGWSSYYGADDDPIQTWVIAEYMTASGVQQKHFNRFDEIKLKDTSHDQA